MINKNSTKKQLGASGEQLALDHMLMRGCKLLAQNWRCRTGEIDLIFQMGETAIFVEVRTRRRTGTFGAALESIDFRKQRKIMETARVFAQQMKWDKQMRFDVIAIEIDSTGEHDLCHIENAF